MGAQCQRQDGGEESKSKKKIDLEWKAINLELQHQLLFLVALVPVNEILTIHYNVEFASQIAIIYLIF